MDKDSRISLLKYELNLGDTSVEYVPFRDCLNDKLHELFREISRCADSSVLDDAILAKWDVLHAFLRITNGGNRVMDVRLPVAYLDPDVKHKSDNAFTSSFGLGLEDACDTYDTGSLSEVDMNLVKYERGEPYSDRLRIRISNRNFIDIRESVHIHIEYLDRRFRNLTRKSYIHTFVWILLSILIRSFGTPEQNSNRDKKISIPAFVFRIAVVILIFLLSMLLTIVRVTMFHLLSWTIPDCRPRGYFWRERKHG